MKRIFHYTLLPLFSVYLFSFGLDFALQVENIRIWHEKVWTFSSNVPERRLTFIPVFLKKNFSHWLFDMHQ